VRKIGITGMRLKTTSVISRTLLTWPDFVWEKHNLLADGDGIENEGEWEKKGKQEESVEKGNH